MMIATPDKMRVTQTSTSLRSGKEVMATNPKPFVIGDRFEIVPWYSDNEVYCLEVLFFEPVSGWSELQVSELLRRVNQCVADLQM